MIHVTSSPGLESDDSGDTLSVPELCSQLRACLHAARLAESSVCRLLAELADRFDRRVPELRAFSDLYAFARVRFGMGARQARERVRIGRSLRALPEISSAFVAGSVSYAAVREVTRVASPDDEGIWLSLAASLPLRTLERRVVEAAPPKPGKEAEEEAPKPPLAPPRVRWSSPSTVEVALSLPAATWALLERAMEIARTRSEASLSDAEALEAVARDALANVAEASRPDVRSMVVLYTCARCARSEIETGVAPVELEPAAAERISCGAARVDLETEGRTVTHGGQVPAAVRRAVLLRDRMRCRAPGCNRRRYVDVHHVVAREHGGAHSRGNCVTLCTSCHDRVHDGRLLLDGDAEGALRFQDPAGAALAAPVVTPGGHGGDDLGDRTPARDVAAILELLRGRRGDLHPDHIANACGMRYPAVSVALLELQLAGRVGMGFGGGYHLCAGGA